MNSFWREDRPVQLTIGNAVAMALSFLTAPIIARALGPAGRGEIAAAQSVFFLVPILLGFGLPTEVRRISTKGLDAPTIRSARDLALLSLIPAAVIGYGLVASIFADVDPGNKLWIFLGIVAAPFMVIWTIDTGALAGLGQYRKCVVLRLAQPAMLFFAVLIAWPLGAISVPFILLSLTSGTILTTVISMVFVRVSASGERTGRISLLRRGLTYAGSSVAEAALNRVDQVLVLPLIGMAEAGLYSAAATIAALPMALGQALGAQAFRRAAHDKSEDERSKVTKTCIRSASSIIVPSCLVLSALGPLAIIVLFGPDFAHAAAPLWILAAGTPATSIGYIASMMLAARNRGLTMTITQVACLGVGVILLLWLGPLWAAIGAAAASSIASVTRLGLLLAALKVPVSALVPTVSGFRSAVSDLFGS